MSTSRHQHPLQQVWPADLAHRYREAGYWRGETMTGFLRANAERFAERTAIVGQAYGQGDTLQRWSYRAFWQRVETAAAGFLALGLQPGDRVVVQMSNVPEFYSVVFGLFRARLIPVYALPAHRLEEVAHIAQKAEASAYVAVQQHEGFSYCELAAALQARLPQVNHVVIACGDAGGFTSFESFKADPALLPGEDADPQAVAFVQISGGSTGLPKLIPRTHDDYIYSFRASNEICAITPESVYMVVLPAAHNFPMSSPGAFGALYAGATVVVSPSPSPAVAFALIEAEKVTDVGLVPPLALLWAQSAESSSHNLSSLKVIQVGGAKLTPAAARRVLAHLDCRLQQVFGMAEGLINYTRLDDPLETVITTQGRPISPADEILVVDDHGHPLDSGKPGHLLVRGPYTIRAYHDDDAANSRSFNKDGFYRSGDIVVRDAQGYLTVHGRGDDHINRAGEKISAEEIEDHLLAHPQIFDATVVSVPDDYLGERSCAFVITEKGSALRPAELRQWFRNRGVASFKVPDQIEFVDDFDTTAVGKVSRRQLRARLRQRLLDAHLKAESQSGTLSQAAPAQQPED